MLQKSSKTNIRFLIVILFSTVVASASYAQTKTVVKEYTYQGSEKDSKAELVEKAKNTIIERVLESVALAVYSETESRTSERSATISGENSVEFKSHFKNYITSSTAGMVSSEIVSEELDYPNITLELKVTYNEEEIRE